MAKKPTYEELEYEIKKLNKTIIKNENNTREIQELAIIGNWEWDVKQHVLIWSDEVYRIFGLAPGVFKPSVEAFEAAIHPDDREDFLKQREVMLNEKQKVCIDHRIVLPDASIRCVQERTQLILNDQNEVCRVIGTVQDITDRKKAEWALLESEKKYKDLFERSLDCIYIHDFDGNFIDLNSATLNLIGYTKEEIPSLNFSSLLNEDGLLIAFNDVRDIMAKSVEHDLSEYKLKKKNGDYVYIETKGVLIYKDGKPYSIMGIARDITERKKAEGKFLKLHDELEKRVEERTQALNEINKELKVKKMNLEEANTALKVLLKRRNEDHIEMEERILANFNELVMPLTDRLKGSRLNESQKAWVETMEANLKNIISPFSRKLNSKFWGLTSQEFQVANFVKNGKTTKEIANLLCVATSTVDTYRNNIRYKLGIKTKKVNLKTYLSDLK